MVEDDLNMFIEFGFKLQELCTYLDYSHEIQFEPI